MNTIKKLAHILTKEFLEEHYVKLRKDQQVIAKELNITNSSVRNYLLYHRIPIRKSKIDLKGMKFGKWLVLEEYPTIKGHTIWLCECECGNRSPVQRTHLRSGASRQCKKCQGSALIELTEEELSFYERDGVKITTEFKKENGVGKRLCICKCGQEVWRTNNKICDFNKRLICKRCADKKIMFGEITVNNFNRIKRGANIRGIDFDVTPEYLYQLYLSQNRKCALTGKLINLGVKKGKYKISNPASLDRIDSSKGYIENNLQWVSIEINFMKQILNNEEFIKMCQSVVDYQNSLRK